jgi:hypothetical protein
MTSEFRRERPLVSVVLLSQGDWVAFLDVIAYARSSLPGLLKGAVVR